ncbi:hypothetical protein FNV43_RR19236 [Rhamnella rubrinervis]|uniref:DCD domain-containing protein n=1 Tax=Rhamnella rubrinervis TaxID=2594499 RepID=A0A8K0GY77_9ROSA|nr:hypothetical protein FNV43_RR19236 [Rhamnella rubrinervis]
MSRINNYTTSCTATAAATGSSLWQFGTEFREVLASVDGYQTWRANAFENQLRNVNKNSVNHEDDDDAAAAAAAAHDKWHKTLPPAEMLPRNEVLGGYIFVCNNETMREDLRRQLFGLPQKYKDSVRAITPGLPLFLYNYTAHQLHGVYQAVSFGGSNIDPTAWEDRKCRGESRFPAQVRIRIKKNCKPLEEDAFRPILHHYDGPKFRLQLSVPEALALLDLFKEEDH